MDGYYPIYGNGNIYGFGPSPCWRSLRDTSKPWRKNHRWTEVTQSTHLGQVSTTWKLKNYPSMSGRTQVWRSLQVESSVCLWSQSESCRHKCGLRKKTFGVPKFHPNIWKQKAVESCGVESCWIGQDRCAARRSGRTDDEICFQTHKSLKPQP
jgi:hypothetical protein